MKTVYKYFCQITIILLFASVLLTCKKEELGETGFPRVKTIVVSMITDTGVVFKGEITDIPADCQIIDHGFVWSDVKSFTTYFDKVSLGATTSTGSFQASANRSMIEGKKYYFKTFVQTPSATIFGNELEFVSLGSHAPVITSISPTSGSWKDTITIKGKYFSDKMYQMLVYFDDELGANVSCSENEIKTVVPLSLDTTHSKISIQNANVRYPSEHVFTLDPNVTVTSMEPTSGSWNTIIKIRGTHLTLIQSVLFNEIPSAFKSKNDSLAEVRIPANLNSLSSDVILKVNHFEFKAPKKFDLTPGSIKSITPDKGSIGTIVSIKVSNIRPEVAKVSINGLDVPVTSDYDSTLTVVLPLLKSSGVYPIKISDGSFSYEKNFQYLIPEVTGISEAVWGDTITIYGKNFNLLPNWQVSYGTSGYKAIAASITKITDSYIKVLFPSNHDYDYNKMYLEADKYVHPALLDVKIANPIIEEVIEPDGKLVNNEIKIKGKNFNPSYTTVSIVETGEGASNYTQMTNTNITCNMPPPLRGTYSIKVETPGCKPAYLYDCIHWNSPLSKYTEFENLDIPYSNWRYFFRGVDDNTFFVKYMYNNIVYKFNHTAKSYESIGNPFPYIFTDNPFELGNKRYICTGSNNNGRVNSFYEINPENQTYTSLPDFPNSNTIYTKFGVNNKAYVISDGDYTSSPKKLWIFDFNTKTWSSINVNLNLTRSQTTSAFVCGTEVFLFNNYTIYKFDPVNNQFTDIPNALERKRDYLTITPFHLKGNSLFAVFRNYYQECWSFDIVNYTWEKRFYFPQAYEYAPFTYSAGEKVYRIHTSENSKKVTIVEFDPAYLK